MSYQPVILIGAARSGTKLLRDIIARHPAIDRVPYDVNYIWRQGNEKLPHDELTPAMVTPAIRQSVTQELKRFQNDGQFLIEKTVSNCLRVDFVNAIFPTARFIYLVRDGVDVVESVHRQWTTPPDWRYILEKSRTFPLRKAPGYAVNYATSQVKRLFINDEKKLGTWGPRYPGIDDDMRTLPLLEVCARQWAHCIQKADTDLAQIEPSRVHIVRYEEFVQTPRDHLRAIAEWLEVDVHPVAEIDLADISADNIGKGRTRLSAAQLTQITPILEPFLTEQHYVQ